MSKTRDFAKIAYWVMVFSVQVYLLWIFYEWLFMSISMPTSVLSTLVGSWPMTISIVVSISLLLYSLIKIQDVAVKTYFELRKKK